MPRKLPKLQLTEAEELAYQIIKWEWELSLLVPRILKLKRENGFSEEQWERITNAARRMIKHLEHLLTDNVVGI